MAARELRGDVVGQCEKQLLASSARLKRSLSSAGLPLQTRSAVKANIPGGTRWNPPSPYGAEIMHETLGMVVSHLGNVLLVVWGRKAQVEDMRALETPLEHLLGSFDTIYAVHIATNSPRLPDLGLLQRRRVSDTCVQNAR